MADEGSHPAADSQGPGRGRRMGRTTRHRKLPRPGKTAPINRQPEGSNPRTPRTLNNLRTPTLRADRTRQRGGWGEQQRVEMYEHVIRGVEGMRVLGHVQSFDYKYFNKAVAESKIHRKHPIYLQEFLDVKENAKGPIKVPITGPYTLVDWSFGGYYTGQQTSSSLKKQKQEAKREFLLDFVEQVIRPEI